MTIIIIVTIICLFITLWVFAGISYSEGVSIKETIFGEDRSDYNEFKNRAMSRIYHLEQVREIDYVMLKETRDDLKNLKSKLYIVGEGEK